MLIIILLIAVMPRHRYVGCRFAERCSTNKILLIFKPIFSAEGIRRQDVADLAMGALTKGLAPISIFSNLLNAYATLDNKHDITGQCSKFYTNF
jgi:hypothetical protein